MEADLHHLQRCKTLVTGITPVDV